MHMNTDNPCLNTEPSSPEFYQALRNDYKQAWECLYLHAFRSFVPYARQRSAISTDDALDILQEGMAEFSVNLKSGKYTFQGKPVAAYVFTVCRNRWVSFLRKNRIQRVADSTQENIADGNEPTDDVDSAGASFRFPLQDDEPEVEAVGGTAIWEDNEVDWEAVNRAFTEVSDDCQTMLRCFYVEEKPLSECGARIGLQENSAKVKRFRCAQRMKALYVQYKRD